MKCPKCEETLSMAERQGVEIDYCPSCRGVWLDRGELDKIIDRATQMESDPTHSAAPAQSDVSQRQQSDKHSHKHKKKEGGLRRMFEELFD